ncbi:MAG: mannose-6-phosphate isomerase [Clostridia bacterium]|nr:mannose-6-phosphate isomerase [Clostridia bacterium]
MNQKIWKQLPTFAARTYRGGKVMREFLGMGESEDNFYPEDWVSSFTEAKNRHYIKNEGITRISTESTDKLITEVISTDAFGQGRNDSGVLIKLLDAGERLGIQVHPTAEYAKKIFNSSYGKTECWYILSGRENEGNKACVYLGFKEYVTRELWQELFEKQDIEGMLSAMHRFEVSAGDVILVTGGTPHAIGKGCFLIEIQEPSDYTMRAEKTTLAGEVLTPMQIHYGVGEEKMLNCFDYTPKSEKETRAKHFLKATTGELGETELVRYSDTPCFALKKIDGGVYKKKEACFVTVIVTENGGSLLYSDGAWKLCRGDKFFVSADTEITLTNAHAVICYPPKK